MRATRSWPGASTIRRHPEDASPCRHRPRKAWCESPSLTTARAFQPTGSTVSSTHSLLRNRRSAALGWDSPSATASFSSIMAPLPWQAGKEKEQHLPLHSPRWKMSKTEQEHILVVDDDKAFRVATRTLLEDERYRVSCAPNGEAALEGLENSSYDLVLSDMVMGKMSGIELLKELKRRRPEMPVIMVTGFGSIETAVEAMRLGAVDFLTKPSNNDELLIKISKALNMQRNERELQKLREELQTTYRFGAMVSQSEAMKEVIRQIQRVADTDVTVLLQGESGTGKELAARALHFNSIRKDSPFVAVSCSATRKVPVPGPPGSAWANLRRPTQERCSSTRLVTLRTPFRRSCCVFF